MEQFLRTTRVPLGQTPLLDGLPQSARGSRSRTEVHALELEREEAGGQHAALVKALRREKEASHSARAAGLPRHS